jgi:hypothetical protein
LSRHRSNLCRWSLNQNHCLIRSQIPIRSNRIRCRSFRLTACCRNRNRWDQSRWAWIHSSLNRYHWGPMIRILMVCCRFANLTAIRIASLTASLTASRIESRIESRIRTDFPIHFANRCRSSHCSQKAWSPMSHWDQSCLLSPSYLMNRYLMSH